MKRQLSIANKCQFCSSEIWFPSSSSIVVAPPSTPRQEGKSSKYRTLISLLVPTSHADGVSCDIPGVLDLPTPRAVMLSPGRQHRLGRCVDHLDRRSLIPSRRHGSTAHSTLLHSRRRTPCIRVDVIHFIRAERVVLRQVSTDMKLLPSETRASQERHRYSGRDTLLNPFHVQYSTPFYPRLHIAVQGSEGV